MDVEGEVGFEVVECGLEGRDGEGWTECGIWRAWRVEGGRLRWEGEVKLCSARYVFILLQSAVKLSRLDGGRN